MPRTKRDSGLTDNLGTGSLGKTSPACVVRAYNAEGYQEEKFQRPTRSFTSNNLTANRVLAISPWYEPSYERPDPWLFTDRSALPIGAIPSPAGQRAQRLDASFQQVVFSSYAMQVVAAFMMLVMIYLFGPWSPYPASGV